MSFNSPFNNPEQDSNAPSNNFNNAPAYSQPQAGQPTGKNSTISVVGLVLAILLPLVGLIISIIAWKQAAVTGDNRGLAKAGIIVGAIFLALGIIANFVLFGYFSTLDAESLDTTGL